MSLYNMVHGINPLAAMVLAMIGISADNVPRFRDAYYDGKHLCIYTRTGGGNRPYYESPESYRSESGEEPHGRFWNEDLRRLPGFVNDEDDDYDWTYATFRYVVPERFSWFKQWAADKTERPPNERWREFMDRLKTAPPDDPAVMKIISLLKPIIEAASK